MCSKLHAQRMRTLSKATAAIAFVGLLSACSNDAMRFNDVLTTGAAMTPNQHAILHKGTSKQAFPGTNISKPSVVSAPSSTGIRITKPAVSAAPLSNLGTSNPTYRTPQVTAPSYQVPSNPVTSTVSKVKTQAQTLAQKAGAPIVLAPRQTGPVSLTMSGTDSLSTGSVKSAAKAAVVNTAKQSVERQGGWGGAGGTYVTARSGETLYNLSRRFGVPVEAILKANNMRDANALTAGSKILIPAYTYSSQTSVSAPDNHPVTKNVRSSTGFQGQAQGKIATPKPRTAAPKLAAPAQVAQSHAASGGHLVVSGDTLYGIARKYSVSPQSIRDANRMSGSTVRLGQRLVIPNGVHTTRVANALPTPKQVDRMSTGSVPTTSRTQAVQSSAQVKPAYSAPTIQQRSAEKVDTPEKTSAGAFRWPIRGRVITKFGERQNGSVNDGIDISVPEGTPIKAAETGTVIYSGSELADFGNLILVSHSGGWVSAYAHASANKVKRGDKVNRGQVIATSGKTGNASVPKLHFELRKDSTPVNPLNHLAN